MSPAEPSTSQTVPPVRDPEKGIVFIAVSQFGVAFSFNCIMSFMPFYILKISEYGTKETMLWIGLIMGVSPLVTAVAAPFWGSLTTRIRPKLLYQAGTFFNGVIFLLMGFAGSLPLILFLRLCQGFLGGISTIGLVLIAAVLHGEAAPQAHEPLPERHDGRAARRAAPGRLRRDGFRLPRALHHRLRGGLPGPAVLPSLRAGHPRPAEGDRKRTGPARRESCGAGPWASSARSI